MKILHVITSLSPRSGGPTVALTTLARIQAQQGHQVTICTTDADNPSGKLSVATDCPVVEDRVETWYFALGFFRPLCASRSFARWIDNNIRNFDIVHIHGLYRFPPTYAAWRARVAGVPYLIRPHGNLDPFLYRQSHHSLLLKKIYGRLFDIPNLNHATAIHYTTREESQRAQFLGLRSKPIVVPNGIDWRAFQHLPPRGAFRKRLGLRERTPLVLFLGRLNFKKGLDLLVPAFHRVSQKHSDSRLAIVGPDNEGYRAKVRRWCSDYSMIDKVLFVDHVGSQEVTQAFVDSDVFVLPSYTENFGMAVVEAMASGCPVVISDRVNIWRDVQMAGAGIIVPLEPASIARAINKMLADTNQSQAMGARGRIAAEKNFGWTHIVDQLTNLYQELIAEHGSEATYRLSFS